MNIPWRFAVGVFACVIWATSALARDGIDCTTAHSLAEHTICANPNLRLADAALSRDYLIVREAASPRSLAAALVRSQRAWLIERDQGCLSPECLEDRIRAREAILAALAARVSADNPTLLDLTAVWMEGDFRAGEVVPSGRIVSADLPNVGAHIHLKLAQICVEGTCASFGLEPTTLAGRSSDLPALLGLSSTAPAYTVFINGRAAYSLAPGKNGILVAVTDGCDAKGRNCSLIQQDWQPVGAGNKVWSESALAAPSQ